jgi:uncharacterized protein YacL
MITSSFSVSDEQEADQMIIAFVFVGIWLVLGIIGSPVVFLYDQYRTFGRITVGDVVSAIFAVLLGPIVFMMALSLLKVWEYVIYRKPNTKGL